MRTLVTVFIVLLTAYGDLWATKFKRVKPVGVVKWYQAISDQSASYSEYGHKISLKKGDVITIGISDHFYLGSFDGKSGQWIETDVAPDGVGPAYSMLMYIFLGDFKEVERSTKGNPQIQRGLPDAMTKYAEKKFGRSYSDIQTSEDNTATSTSKNRSKYYWELRLGGVLLLIVVLIIWGVVKGGSGTGPAEPGNGNSTNLDSNWLDEYMARNRRIEEIDRETDYYKGLGGNGYNSNINDLNNERDRLT